MVLEIENISFDDFLIKTDKSIFLDFSFFVNMNLYKLQTGSYQQIDCHIISDALFS